MRLKVRFCLSCHLVSPLDDDALDIILEQHVAVIPVRFPNLPLLLVDILGALRMSGLTIAGLSRDKKLSWGKGKRVLPLM